MVYVALLRGINVGGNRQISMAELKLSFAKLPFDQIRSYINSGNIIFRTSEPQRRLATTVEQRIVEDFDVAVSVILRSLPQMEALVAQIPADWVADKDHKSDVIFLRPEVDEPGVIDSFTWDPAHESLKFIPGSLVWQTTMAFAAKSKVLKLNQRELYQHVTIRNTNTVRKLLALMREV